MLLYADLVTGDELATDALPMKELDGGILEIESERVVVGGEDIDIGRGNQFGGGDPEEGADDAAETVINIVHSHSLKLANITKAEYKALIKAYWPRLKEKIEKQINDAESDYEKNQAKEAYNKFKANFPKLKEFVNETIVKNFDEFEFYTGESQDLEGMLIPARYVGEAVAPTLYMFLDGLRVEKA
jgi:hypothetical protein